MAEFFHSTIDEVAALPQIKRDFEAVSKKLKDDEVVMMQECPQEGAGGRNQKLKSDLDTKRLKPSKPSWKNKRWRRILRGLGRSGRLRRQEFEKEIQRVEDLWDESAEEDPSVSTLYAPPPMHPLILEADIASGDMKGPSESEMVDAQILGLEDNKSDGDATVLPDVQG
ncbi:outer membrane protein assembly factor BamA [Sesbania bispinosa]|nr:outer membrane protein assembly factor BamA [Sesbania bispinosa]